MAANNFILNIPNIHSDWIHFFQSNISLLESIFNHINDQPFYPPLNCVFNAFQISPNHVKICLLGMSVLIHLSINMLCMFILR